MVAQKTVCPMLSDRCPVLSCLSVALVYCGQMVGWIKMSLGREIGLGPSDIVLNGDPAPPSEKGAQQFPLFGRCLLLPNGYMDQDATWYRGRPWPRPHSVRWGCSSPQKVYSPHFLALVYCSQMAGCMDVSICHLAHR